MRTPARLPAWLIERLALGELKEPLLEDTRRRLEVAPGLNAELSQLAKENAEFLASNPPEQVLPGIRERIVTHRKRAAPRRRAFVLGAVSALAMILWLLPRLLDVSSEPASEERIKGEPELLVFRKRPSGHEQLKDGDTVRRGDVLQLRYHAASHRYGVILSVDGAGNVTRHFPESDGASTALAGNESAFLTSGYELDDAPRFERFFFMSSDRPLDAEAMTQAVRSWAQSGFPPSAPLAPTDVHLFSIAFEKSAR